MGKIRTLLADREVLVLNGLLLLFFILITCFSPFRPADELLLFSPDSQTYFNTGGEFFHFSEQGNSIIRPFFYSCLLRSGHFLGGAWLMVILQSLFWLVSANLVYFGIKCITKHLLYRIAAIVVFSLNISLMTYVFHGLTESITVLLLSIITFLTARSFQKGFNVQYFLKITFLLSLLTVTKPLFQYPALFWVLFGIIRFSKTILAEKKAGVLLVVAVFPILLQLTAMYSKYGIFKISEISELTFDTYLFAQGIRKVEGITDIELSQEIAQNMDPEEKRNYLSEHKKTYAMLFAKNVKDNITGDKHSFIIPPGYAAKGYNDFMIIYNETLYSVSRVFLLFFLVISAIDLFTKKLFRNWQQLAIGLLLYYIVFSSGISFWQGDRLVIFSIPLWITLYVLLLTRIINSNFAAGFFSKRASEE